MSTWDTIKTAAYERVMNAQGTMDYDPYQDPQFLQELKPGTAAKNLGRAAQIGLTVGGLGKTVANLRKGRIGTVAPIVGGLGLTSLALDDYVQ